MEVGLQLIFENVREQDGVADHEMYAEEIRLAGMAEDLGFDSLWPVEHHFTSYAMSPDPALTLAYFAARTTKIKLATGAFILPWNDPLRVAEKLVVLDHLSDGRLLVGFGRGLARVEFEGFGIDQDEARERFDEAAAMIVAALETGVVENDGPHYPQKRVELRPRPHPDRPFGERTYSVAMTPASQEAAAKLGVGMVAFKTTSMEEHLPAIDKYRELFRGHHGSEAPPPVISQITYCHEDPAVAERVAREYLGKYFLLNANHYEFLKTDWAKGYESYAADSKALLDAGTTAAQEAYVDCQLWGTPEQIVETLAKQREVLGEFNLNTVFSSGGMPYDMVEESMSLFAREVIPNL